MTMNRYNIIALRQYLWLPVACILTSPGYLYGQHERHQTGNYDNHEFIEMVRQATVTYHDIEVAKYNGYVKFGPDMPNMGEHYVNPSIAIRRDLDFTRPSVLTYLPVDDDLILTGVAYTVPVNPGEQPPVLPFHKARWHFHSGNLMEEAFGLHEKGMHDEESGIVRLGMLHAWVWSDNPNGLFTADNWALAYKRLGLESPIQPLPDAARCLFLMHGGVDYYSRFVELAVEPEPELLDKMREVIYDYALTVQQTVDVITKRSKVSISDEKALASIWQSMWNDICELLPDQDSSILKEYLVIDHDH
jgi:hypothetical protein